MEDACAGGGSPDLLQDVHRVAVLRDSFCVSHAHTKYFQEFIPLTVKSTGFVCGTPTIKLLAKALRRPSRGITKNV